MAFQCGRQRPHAHSSVTVAWISCVPRVVRDHFLGINAGEKICFHVLEPTMWPHHEMIHLRRAGYYSCSVSCKVMVDQM